MFMELPISGLHKLFHATALSATARTSRAPTPLESVTEEAHTYDLLYPDLGALRQAQDHVYPLKQSDPSSSAQAANSYDDRGGLDLQSPRDVRIIIAQDGNILSQQPRVLYDSQPPPSLPITRQGDTTDAAKLGGEQEEFQQVGVKRRISAGKGVAITLKERHTRHSSLGHNPQSSSQPASPILPRSPEVELRGAFSNPKLQRQRSGLRPATGDGETTQGRLVREGREETDALLGCMFGSTGLPLVSSTKLHVKSARSSEPVNFGALVANPSEASSARVFAKRRTPLKRSTTAEDLHKLSSSSIAEDPNQTFLRPNNASILITRLFSIDPAFSNPVPERGGDKAVQHASYRQQEEQEPQRPTDLAGPEKAKQVKTPTYAVAIVLQLPFIGQRSLMPATQPRSSTAWSSERPNQYWEDPLQTLVYANNTERDIEQIIVHWNILTRAVSSLEVVALSKIHDLLSKVGGYASNPYFSAHANDSMRGAGKLPMGTKQKTVKQPSQRTVQLQAGALQDHVCIQQEAAKTGERISLAIRIRRVVAGQGRWGMWREEARWVGRWAGGREQNFFFFNLLTAFLGCHTEWLDSLGPSWYRRRHTQQLRGSLREVSTIKHRTIIVSADKMTSRRLIFLLSGFLPGGKTLPVHDGAQRHHSSWSNTGRSQSPPSGVSVLREQSLRRTLNKRPRGNRAGLNARTQSISYCDQDLGVDEDRVRVPETKLQQHSRCSSDTRSIRTLPLPISIDNPTTRKSSTTTTTTVTPDPAIPVPHFASYSTEPWIGTAAEPRPGSSGSLASLSLKHTLSRSGSNGQGPTGGESPSVSRWGSMISGFWSVRRSSSTDDSDLLDSAQEGLGISGVPQDSRTPRSGGNLVRMVEEGDKDLHVGSSSPRALDTHIVGSPPDFAGLPAADRSTPARNIPERPKPEQFPVKLSIDESDGVVDVDIPATNSCSSSFASSMSSPKGSQTAASSFNEHSSLHGHNSMHDSSSIGSEPTIDVAGWLKRFHQDFALQAVRPYEGLKEDIKRAMRAEPHQSPPPTFSNSDKDPEVAQPWTNVCTSLIADTTTFTITRLSLQRRTNPSQTPTTEAPPSSSHQTTHPQVPIIPLETPSATTERILTSKIMDMDSTLIDAIERVLAQSGPSPSSRAPSPSRSRGVAQEGTHSPSLSLIEEIPRAECKKLVLGALEMVARSVSADMEHGGLGIQGEKMGEKDSTLREGVRRWLGDVAGGR